MKNQITFIIIYITTTLTVFAQNIYDTSINTGGSLQTHPGSQMGIFGDLNNDGSFTENQGEVGFYNRDDVQNITGNNAPEISDLIVGVPNDLNIEVNTIINTGVIFNDGRIITPRRDPNISLDLVQTDLYLNEGNDTHVDGYNSYTGDNAYTFPVGDEFRFRPLSIEALASQNTSSAAYFLEDPNTPTTFAGFDRTELDDNVGTISPVEFWDLNGEIPTRVTLTWDIISNIPNLVNDNFNELFVAGWSIADDIWVNLGNINVSGDANQGTLTSEIFTPNDYEIITFGGTISRAVTDEEIFVYNTITDNGDNFNPYFRIAGIEDFPINNLQIFNRWGVKVFDKDGYTEPEPERGEPINSSEVFTGISNGRATVKRQERLPSGTYFYILKYGSVDTSLKRKAGFLYLQ